ncbi:unnamed protein product [Nyctereutes procyonoides]|uniref:(raccoon dog) hypothetical protein n=1 Tax=Nyctereutes procyonoides TaxID=34880 RepID=A0A811Z8Y9_NYCPR|nr:unnamed protein product [Nyctereutes procyonoides]
MNLGERIKFQEPVGSPIPVGTHMELHPTHPTNRKAKADSNAVPFCGAKPSPSFISRQKQVPLATFLKIQTKLPSGGKQRTLPVSSHNPLLNHLPQFSK